MVQIKLLLLILIANGAPILGRRLFGNRLNLPLDGGRKFFDGRPVLGHAKTLRGLVLSIFFTTLCATLLGFAPHIGLLIGSFAMLGDIAASFTKRRLGRPPHTMALGIDQIPESLFPLLAIKRHFSLGLSEIAALVTMFLILELLISRILFKLHIRNQPY